MENNLTYIDAFNELQSIVTEIEQGDVNVDELAKKIERASTLIHICKAKLSASEEEVQRLLQALQTEENQTINEEEE